MKNIKIFLVFIFLMMSKFIIAQDLVGNRYRNCTIFKFNYKNGVIDSNSKEIFKIISYNENGKKIEEKFFWEGELSQTNNYLYDSLGHLVVHFSKSNNTSYDYSIKYVYDSIGKNTITYINSNEGTINGHQNIEYDKNGKETKHSYFDFDDTLNVIETFSYNENGLLTKKIISTHRTKIMEIIEHYVYDSDNLLIETNIERIPELVSRRDNEYWLKEEKGFELKISIPLPSFEKKIIFYYDTNKRISKIISYYNENTARRITEYYYSEFGLLEKEILSFDYSPIKETFKSENLEHLYDELAPIHFTSKSLEPRQELIYNYSK